MNKYKILVVDDIFINRVLLSEIIKDIGSDMIEAENGKEAIELLESNSIDIVLMDIEMPVMNGFEATRHIRQLESSKKDTPVIAITAHDPNSFFDEYTDAGFDELITKPYTVEKISYIIKQFCEKK